MRNPPSREQVERYLAPETNSTTERMLAEAALHYLDRVAELEKERDEAIDVLDWAEAPAESGGVTLNVIGRIRALNAKRIIEGNQRAGKLIERADRVEADLAAAQEALRFYADPETWDEEGRAWKVHAQDDGRDVGAVACDVLDALARGGGQETKETPA